MSLRLLVTAHSDAQGRTFRYDFDDDRSQILLGRRGGVDVLLPSAGVSLVHARIERRSGGAYTLVDDHSTSGTSINGTRLDAGAECALRQGDRIAIADFVLEVAEADVDAGPHAGESSLSMARRMVQDVLGVLGPGVQHPTLCVLDPSGQRTADEPSRQLAIDSTGIERIVGRDAGCDLVLEDDSVAARHLRLVRGERGVVANDLGSPFGLYVNDRFVAGERLLVDGDVVAIGRVRLRFTDPAELYLRRLELDPGAAREPAAGDATGGAADSALIGHTSSDASGDGRPPSAADDAGHAIGERFVGAHRIGEWWIAGAAVAIALAAASGLLYLWLL